MRLRAGALGLGLLAAALAAGAAAGAAACAGSGGESRPSGSGHGASAQTQTIGGSEPGGARATQGAHSFCNGLETDGEAPPGEARLERDADTGARELEAGLALAEKGDHAQAVEAFNRAIAADPILGLAYLEAAESRLYTDNDSQEIRRLLARALDLLPANPRAHLRYADVVHELGQGERAEAHWRCALEHRPDLVDARKHLGMYLLSKGRIEEAEAELTRAAADAPDDLQTHVALANALEAAKKPLEAAKEVEAAAKIAEKSAALYRRAGQLYEDAGNFVAAKRMRAAADRLDPPAKERRLRPLPKARK